MSSFLGIRSPLSKYFGVDSSKQSPVDKDDLKPDSSGSTPPVNRHNNDDDDTPDDTSPSVDSAVDMTSPLNSLERTNNPPRLHRLSSSSFTALRSSPSLSQTFLEGGGGAGLPSRSISFVSENRDSSFDGEPDIPELFLEEKDEETDLITSENYFAQPELLHGGSTVEIKSMIDDYKGKIQSIEAVASGSDAATAKALWTEKKQDLVSKLVQLRIKQQDLKDKPSVEETEFKKILGHKFKRRDPATSAASVNCFIQNQEEEKETKLYCEQCLRLVWRLVQTWYRCVSCGFACHTACLNHVVRTCVSTRLRQPPGTASFADLQSCVSMEICPEKGLVAQNYKCHECKGSLCFGSYASEEPRLCDYSGYFYCYKCHWNDAISSPARILHNWDFEAQLVCRSSRQLIRLIKERPFIRIADINPMLFSFVSELDRIKTLREKILIMKLYLTSCKKSLEEKLLLRLRHRQHFVENSDMYSLQDLIDIQEGILEPELQKIHDHFVDHICVSCELCRAKGFVCEQCSANQVIFPFGTDVVVCPRCSNVFHRLCFRRCEGACRRCDLIEERRKRRTSVEALEDDVLQDSLD